MGKCKTKAVQVTQAYSGIFRHIQELFRNAHTHALCNPDIFRALVYLEPWHIQNPDVIRTLSYSIPGIFRILVYSFGTLSNIYDEAFSKIIDG